MLNIILTLLLFHYVGFFLRKAPNNTLFCGIWGWSGKDVKDFSKDKFNMLGIANQERGRDSCGIGVNGDIYKGVNSVKKYEDFISKNYHEDDIFKPTSVKSIIAHTRKASVGAVSTVNAHPFGFGYYKKKFAFYGLHNGTIYNKDEIAEEFNLEETAKVKGEIVDRRKIDSELLLEAIYRSKGFKVLSMYQGAAAIAFVNLKTPTRLYLFRGKSKKFHTEMDERPLFVFKQSKNSLYFSSIKESLYFIGGTDETVFEIEPNTVYEIKNGDINSAELFKINRDEASQAANTRNTRSYTAPNRRQGELGFQRQDAWEDDFDSYQGWGSNMGSSIPIVKNSSPNCSVSPISNKKIIKKTKDLLTEDPNESIYTTTPQNALRFSNDLRFYTKLERDLATGLFCFFPRKGFSPLGKDPEKAFTTMYDRLGKYYVAGRFHNSVDYWQKQNATIPFPELRVHESIQKYIYYFVNGMMLKTKIDYVACLAASKTAFFNLDKLSHMSVFPVMKQFIKEEETTKEDLTAIINGRPFSGKLLIPGGNKKYMFSKGILKRLKPTNSMVPEYGATHFPDTYISSTYPLDKKEDRVITTKEANHVLLEHNKMVKEKAKDSLESVVLLLDAILQEVEPFKDHDDIKEVTNIFKDCEQALYDGIDNLDKS